MKQHISYRKGIQDAFHASKRHDAAVSLVECSLTANVNGFKKSYFYLSRKPRITAVHEIVKLISRVQVQEPQFSFFSSCNS